MLRAPIGLALAFVLMGCSVRVGDFTLVSTKNIGQLAQKGDNVEGEDCVYLLFGFIPLGNVQANAKTAVDRALDKGRGDVIIDGVFERTWFLIPYIWGQDCYRVEGRAATGEFAKQ